MSPCLFTNLHSIIGGNWWVTSKDGLAFLANVQVATKDIIHYTFKTTTGRNLIFIAIRTPGMQDTFYYSQHDDYENFVIGRWKSGALRVLF